MQIAALVLAAGSATRFGGQELKQYQELRPGERLVDRTVATARQVADWVGLVLPPGESWSGERVDRVVVGGDSRHESLRAGLGVVPAAAEVVLVHSASHPLASADLARSLLATVAAGADGAVPFLGAVDVVKRRGADGGLTTVGREGLGSAQCPMAFDRRTLDRAFAEVDHATEESALVEMAGGRVVAVKGEVSNLHVVDRASLEVARAVAGAHRGQIEGGDVSSPRVGPV